MAYHEFMYDLVHNTGSEIGQLAVQLDFSINKIAKATGATRQTVYNWFYGAEISNAYKDRVDTLIEIMKKAKDADDAWKKAVKKFGLAT